MAKKWNEVTASPEYQSLSAPDRAAAQAQYFDQVVKPQISPEQVDAAHSQFYQQYPVGGASASPTPTEPANVAPTAPDDRSSLLNPNNYSLERMGEAFSTLGKDIALGASHWLTTDHDTGQEQAPTGAASEWYSSNMANPETRQAALESEKALKMGAQVAAYTTGAGAVEALAANTLPKAVGFVASNVAGSLASQAVGDEDLSLRQTAEDVALAGVIGGGAKAIGGAVRGIRSVLPEAVGGFSQAEKTAAVANPEFVQKVLQGGNEEAQQTFRTATTNEAGESIVLPSQALNGRYVNAEYRDMLRGQNSQYAPVLAEQQSGESIGRAVSNADAGVSVKQSATDITNQFKEQASQLYNDSKAQAQSILDGAKVGQIKLSNTKQLAAKHLAEDSEMGKVNLNATTRKMLSEFQKAKINNIDTLDKWKRALNEQANAQYRAGNHTASQTLRDVSGSLRGEADRVISSIHPEAGSIYREADSYFSQSVGDFGTGKKSALGKVAANESESGATSYLVGTSQRAAERTQNASEALNSAIESGSLDDAARLSLDFSGAVGSATRNEAMRVAESGANFSPTKFANRLNQLEPQATAASSITGAGDELAVNNALLDAVGLTRNRASNAGRVTTALSSIGGRASGAVVGGLVGSVVPGVGTAIGGIAGERAAKAISTGLIDRIAGTNRASQRYINFLSDPANAQKVADILESRGGVYSAPAGAITDAIDQVSRVGTGYASVNAPSVPAMDTNNVAPIQPEPVQRAQSVNAGSNSFEPKITRLYSALAHAETGGVKGSRFIRTRAAESGVSTAYGPAQLTVSTMQDFAKRHGTVFNAKERDYISRFIDQGQKMKHAAKGDSVYGYGGSGVLNSKEDQKLYANVVRKMLNQMVKDNGGSLDKTVKRWRGNDNDHAYFNKVRNAFKSS